MYVILWMWSWVCFPFRLFGGLFEVVAIALFGSFKFFTEKKWRGEYPINILRIGLFFNGLILVGGLFFFGGHVPLWFGGENLVAHVVSVEVDWSDLFGTLGRLDLLEAIFVGAGVHLVLNLLIGWFIYAHIQTMKGLEKSPQTLQDVRLD